MIKRKVFTSEQVYSAIKNGEFDQDILNSKQKVVVIMTQDWCPQWLNIKNWVYSLQTDEDIDVFELIYNKADYYNAFMKFKENNWGNFEIPYLRYYNSGKLFKESNYVGMQVFKDILKI
jgi:hypothetical protein